MKIDPAAPQRPVAVRRNGAAGPAKSDGFARALAEDAPAAGVGAAGRIDALNGVFALQEVTDPTERRRLARRRGNELLDRLDDIRHGLLAGAIPLAGLEDLARALRAHRGDVDDPRLADLLDHIDLRAAVELAKLSWSA
jgi:hypothetical protein